LGGRGVKCFGMIGLWIIFESCDSMRARWGNREGRQMPGEALAFMY
jgi:hypothetical protein